jgi:hypothetical protein
VFCGDGNLGHLAGLIEHHAGDRHREALRLKTLSEHVCCALFAKESCSAKGSSLTQKRLLFDLNGEAGQQEANQSDHPG